MLTTKIKPLVQSKIALQQDYSRSLLMIFGGLRFNVIATLFNVEADSHALLP